MGIESIVALALATAFLVGLSFYASSHRAEDADKHQADNKSQNGVKHA